MWIDGFALSRESRGWDCAGKFQHIAPAKAGVRENRWSSAVSGMMQVLRDNSEVIEIKWIIASGILSARISLRDDHDRPQAVAARPPYAIASSRSLAESDWHAIGATTCNQAVGDGTEDDD